MKHGHNTREFGRSRTYNCWINMKQRCLNRGNSRYKDYGGRGISIDHRWLSFDLFLEDMGECPEGLTIERIDNDGDYTKENCKWDTVQKQNLNKRVRSDSLTGRKGVHFYARTGKYMAYVKRDGKKIHLGCFDFAQEAVEAREKWLASN